MGGIIEVMIQNHRVKHRVLLGSGGILKKGRLGRGGVAEIDYSNADL
jgi:hypothetical protein